MMPPVRTLPEQAWIFAAASLAAAERSLSATLDRVSLPRICVGGIAVPASFHHAVVRRSLARLSVDRRGGCHAP
jgi:hypothetical protein